YSVIHHFMKDEYVGEFFRQVYRLLKPGGAALIADIPDKAQSNKPHQESGFVSKLRLFVSRKISRWYNQDEVVNLARSAGLEASILNQSDSLPFHDLRFDLLLTRV